VSVPPSLGPPELPVVGPAVVTLGVFDGVHAGHRAMLEATRVAAAERGVASVAIVFDPPPDEVLRPGNVVERLAPLGEVLGRISDDCGIGHALPLRFDDALRSLAPEEFLDAIAGSIQLRALVMSPESAFGRGRAGTVARLRQIGAERGFEVLTVDPVVADGSVVSSSRLRELITAGDVAAAGRIGSVPYLEGEVVAGDHRGRGLGYPTANLSFDYRPAVPANGIYVGRAAVPDRGVGQGHPALVSIGVRPTFHTEGTVLVEVHLLDFDGDLYGATLELEVLERLREERRFETVDQLVAQMHRDEASARRFLGLPPRQAPG
jgi:riboflavin kinase/FMN adenylyltransferase